MRILGLPVFEMRRYEPWASLLYQRGNKLFDPSAHTHSELRIPSSPRVGLSSYSLGHADSSRFKAIQAMLLLEDHLVNDPCPDCMNKHSMLTSALLQEAATLQDGNTEDVARADLVEMIRQDINKYPQPAPGYLGLQRRVRDVRKSIQNEMGLGRA